MAQEQPPRPAFRRAHTDGPTYWDSVERRCLSESQVKLPPPVTHSKTKEANITPEVILLIAVCCALIAGCRSRTEVAGPSIEFTRVPPAEAVRTEKLDVIQGRVLGARPGQQIVLYARTGAWWVQPISNEPYTSIQADSTWINTIHLGSEYAALLVDPSYRPRSMVDALPGAGGQVAAIATTPGATSGTSVSAPLQFSGYEWRVRNAPSGRGGTPNIYDPANAWTDAGGALHLRVAKQADAWTCAEVILTRSFGYGTYSFVVRDTSHLEPAIIFEMFSYDYAGGDQNNREMSVEIGRWGDPSAKNGQYILQPYYVPANFAHFPLPPGVLTHSFRWEPGRVAFRTIRGTANGRAPEIVGEHVFTSGVPGPGAESVRMALYVFGGADTPAQKNNEVVVYRFEYLP